MTGHVITVESVTPNRFGVAYQAVCSCGWVGTRHVYPGRAEATGRAHVREVSRP